MWFSVVINFNNDSGRKIKFDVVKDIFIPIIIGLSVVVANNYFFLNQKVKESKVNFELERLSEQKDILNRILLFSFHNTHSWYRVRKLKKEYIDAISDINNKSSMMLAYYDDILKNDSVIMSSKQLHEMKLFLDSLESSDFETEYSLKNAPDSAFFVASELPRFLLDSNENVRFNESIVFFNENKYSIDHRIGLVLDEFLFKLNWFYGYDGKVIPKEEVGDNEWVPQRMIEWNDDMNLLYSLSYEYLNQKSFDGRLEKIDKKRIRDYVSEF